VDLPQRHRVTEKSKAAAGWKRQGETEAETKAFTGYDGDYGYYRQEAKAKTLDSESSSE